VGPAKKRQEVVFTYGVEGDITQDYRIPVSMFKDGVNGVCWIKANARKQFHTHAGYPLRSSQQPLPLRVFTDGFQNGANCLFNTLLVDNSSS
jgi:hypothetical protein